MKKISTIIVALGISCAGMAGLLFDVFPIFSLILTMTGIVATIIIYLRTENKLDANEHSNKVIAMMMSKHGLGSLYANEYFSQMLNEPKAKNPELIKKAFEITPNDESAVSLYCTHKALELSFKEWQGFKNDVGFKKELCALKKLVNDKIIIYPQNHSFCMALGIILDIEGDHKLAREAFRKAGTLGKGPFWRISVSVSFIKEGLYDDALEELKHAEAEGKKNINIHFGRVYQEKGDYRRSEEYFRKAIKYDSFQKGVMRTAGWKAQAIEGISYGLYCQGKFIRSSLIRVRLGFYLLMNKSFMRGIVEIVNAILKLLIGIAMRISKTLIPLYVKFPSLQIIARKFPPDRIEYLIGNKLLEEQHYNAASVLLKKAFEIQRRLNNKRKIIEISLNLGNCYLSQKAFLSEAESLYKESLRLSEELNSDLGRAMAHGMLSSLYKLNDNSKYKEHEAKHFEYLKKIDSEEIKKRMNPIEIDI